MKIAYLGIEDAGKLAHVYNEQIVGVPHCYAVSPEDFEAGLPYRKFDDRDYHEDIHSEKFIIGEQDGKIVSFADVAIAEIEEGGQKESKGFIRFLTYLPGYRPVGQAILEESERHLTDSDISQIKAFRLNFRNDHCGYHFYHLGYSSVSDQMGHVCALLHMNGYKINGGEIFLDQPEYRANEPVLPHDGVEITIKQGIPEKAVLPGLDVIAYRSGKWIGHCESTSAAEFCQAREAQDWVFISGLYIIEAERGKGWGRYLLQRNLWEMRKIGYKNTVISADIANYRAHLFYMNDGYRVADTTYEFVKNI